MGPFLFKSLAKTNYTVKRRYNMAQYNFIDDIGLKDLLREIHNFYASKTELLEELRRAQLAEGDLAQKVFDEQTRAEQAEADLVTAIQAEGARVERLVNAEATARDNADLELQQETVRSLDTLRTTLAAQIQDVSNNLNSEVTTLNNLISGLDTGLTNEIQNRQTAVSSLRTSLEGQISTVQTNINTFFNQRCDDLESAILGEANLRAQGDSGLSGRIDQLISDVDDEFIAQAADLKAYIREQISRIDLEGVKSIITVPVLPAIATAEDLDLLYLQQSDCKLYHWNGSIWEKMDSDLRAEFETLSDTVDTINADLGAEILTRIALSDTVSEHDALLDQHDTSISEMENTVNELASIVIGDTTNLKEDVEALQEDIGQAQIDITTLQTKVGDGVAPILTDLSQIHNNLDLTNSRIDSVLIKNASQDESIEELGTNITGVAADLAAHAAQKDNPHQVTAAQIGLDKVENTTDLEKPVSLATREALAEKLNIEDIRDTIGSTEADKPLSAKQGAVLSGMIQDANTRMENRITALGNAFHFKGTVPSVASLPRSTDDPAPVQGDCWQIKDPSDPEAPDTGAMYSWTGSSWTQVVASVVDISAYAMTTNEVYAIIDNFIPE